MMLRKFHEKYGDNVESHVAVLGLIHATQQSRLESCNENLSKNRRSVKDINGKSQCFMLMFALRFFGASSYKIWRQRYQ